MTESEEREFRLVALYILQYRIRVLVSRDYAVDVSVLQTRSERLEAVHSVTELVKFIIVAFKQVDADAHRAGHSAVYSEIKRRRPLIHMVRRGRDIARAAG